jgi:hypothetical protein
MRGGFTGVGTPTRVIDTLLERSAKGLTVICNDAARFGPALGKLIDAGWGDDHPSVVLPSKCSVDASASALVVAFNPSRCSGGL